MIGFAKPSPMIAGAQIMKSRHSKGYIGD